MGPFENASFYQFPWAGIAQSVQRLATGWKVWGSNPCGGEIFRTCPDRPWSPSTLLYNRYRVSFSRVRRPGRGVNQPPPSRAEVEEGVELYVYSPFGPSWLVLGRTLPLPFTLPSYYLNTFSRTAFHSLALSMAIPSEFRIDSPQFLS